MIPVTKPFSPPLSEYFTYLEDIWNRNWFTNNGPVVNELEQNLKGYLDVSNLLFLNNGTIAIQLAIKCLELKGEIITTPFSYVATTSSIVWEGLTPIFVDIDPVTFNIDPTKLESAITSKTTAILATHVFGNPCEIDAIQKIADKYSLKVIYDAAHCFGTLYKGKSIFEFGDISTTSFHATKLFHTIEGGAVFSKNNQLIKKLMFLRNFGHNGQLDFAEVGINAKNSEFHAAMGLANLKYIDQILAQRKILCSRYSKNLEGLSLLHQKINNFAKYNYAYYPVVFESEAKVLSVISELEKNSITPRRYFHPSLNIFKIFNKSECPQSESISSRILCLPLYHDLKISEVDKICDIIRSLMLE
jgi:dTDP-4-amino-4,6-dideoxygalactose transaminase